jgi:hypothetical protein
MPGSECHGEERRVRLATMEALDILGRSELLFLNWMLCQLMGYHIM